MAAKKKTKRSIIRLIKPFLRFLPTLILILLLGTTAFYLAKRYRGLIVAGVVNKSIISRWQLNKTLSSRFGQTVLNELIEYELLRQAVADNDIVVTSEEIQAEYAKYVDSLGGEDQLKTALAQYGMSQSEFEDQIRLRLSQRKLAEKLFAIEVTDEEVKKYFTTNSSLYKSKKLDEVKDEIKANLTQEKLQTAFFTWFEDYKSQAQIASYL